MTDVIGHPSKVILLVEDNRDDVDLTVRALRKNHIPNDVVVAGDGEAALDYLLGTGTYADRPHPVPELILLDLKLPRIGGLELLQRIRENEVTRYVPVVVLTSSTEDSDSVSAYELRANSYVHKPVDYSEFMEAARQLGLYWLELNVTPCSRPPRNGG